MEAFTRKEEALRRHCQEVGRDEREIERTVNIGPVLIRDSRTRRSRGARRDVRAQRQGGDVVGRPASAQPTGSPEHVVELLHPFVAAGYRHVVFGFPAPYDEETMSRLISEVQAQAAPPQLG